VVRKRGQLELCTLNVERTPRTTTELRRSSVTAPAPRVVYQSRAFDTAQCDAPDTARPEPLLVELTPLEGCSPLDEVAELDDEDDVVFDADALVEDAPGMVAALTAAKTPTAATAPTAAPTVRRLRRRSAASREIARVLSMLGKSVSGR
jgi:hypothetical protein